MDQVDKLILQVQGQEELRYLNTALEHEQKALRELVVELNQGKISQQQFDAAARAAGASIVDLTRDIKRLSGRAGLNGSGILQASYAVQDFTSMLSGGMGLDRAIMAVQNNIPGLLMALGMGGGLAGAISLVSVGIGALIPLIEQWWGTLDDPAAIERAKERLRELTAEIKRTHDEFQKLANAPTDAERLSAEGVGLFLKERPNAERAKRAVAEGMTNKEAWEMLTPDERKAWKASEKDATTPVDVAAEEWRKAEEERIGKMGPMAAAMARQSLDMRAAEARAGFERRRHDAIRQQQQLMRQGRERKAEAIVSGAVKPGHEHAGDRQRLFELTPGMPGLQEMRPERIQAAEAEYAAQQEADQAEAEAVERHRKARREANRRREEQQTLEAQGRVNERRMEKRLEAERAREGAAAEKDIHARARATEAERAAEAHRSAEDVAVNAAVSRGWHPTAEQADQLATDTQRLMQQGLSAQQAAMSAVMGRMRAMNQAMANWQQQQQALANQMGMGQDNSGQFSPFPPMW